MAESASTAGYRSVRLGRGSLPQRGRRILPDVHFFDLHCRRQKSTLPPLGPQPRAMRARAEWLTPAAFAQDEGPLAAVHKGAGVAPVAVQSGLVEGEAGFAAVVADGRRFARALSPRHCASGTRRIRVPSPRAGAVPRPCARAIAGCGRVSTHLARPVRFADRGRGVRSGRTSEVGGSGRSRSCGEVYGRESHGMRLVLRERIQLKRTRGENGT
jgi:hypothetical protein